MLWEPWYFIFNGIDSRSMGVHVIKYPPIVMPPERLTYITVPGRSGDLTQTQGTGVYDAYTKVMEVSNGVGFNPDRVTKWLRGRGTMIFGNEPKYKYIVDLGNKCQLDRVIHGVWGGQLQMRTQPFKQLAIPEPDITLTANKTIFNPGDVPAYPLFTFSAVSSTTVSATITLNGTAVTWSQVQKNYTADFEIQWLMDANGTPLANVMTGAYTPLLPGNNTVRCNWTNVTSLKMTPRWRYL